jgi:hypothetical protein
MAWHIFRQFAPWSAEDKWDRVPVLQVNLVGCRRTVKANEYQNQQKERLRLLNKKERMKSQFKQKNDKNIMHTLITHQTIPVLHQ